MWRFCAGTGTASIRVIRVIRVHFGAGFDGFGHHGGMRLEFFVEHGLEGGFLGVGHKVQMFGARGGGFFPRGGGADVGGGLAGTRWMTFTKLPAAFSGGSRLNCAPAKTSFFHSRWAYVVGMNAMQIEYPEAWTAAAGSTPERFENEARMALAMKLFEMGRLTSGQAAQLAGVSRVAFLFNCPQWNVPAVNLDAAELAAEFKPLRP